MSEPAEVVIEDSIVAALIRDGLASHELNWAGSWLIRRTNGEILDVAERLAAAIDDPAELPEFREWLTSLGVVGKTPQAQASRVISTVTSSAVASPPE